MKYAIITDIHFGVHCDQTSFVNYQKDYFKQFWEYIDENEVGGIIFCGDFFHTRKAIDIEVLYLAKDMWWKPLSNRRHLKCYHIVGNHDVYYKNTNETNSIRIFTSKLDNVVLIENKPLQVNNMLFIPWINNENLESIVQALDTSNADIVLGHFELSLNNEPYYKNQLDVSLLERFKLTISGHIHNPFTKTFNNGNTFKYIGSPYETSWNEYGIEDRGFYVLDGFDLKLIKNNKPIHFIRNIKDVAIDNNTIQNLPEYACLRVLIPTDYDSLKREMDVSKISKLPLRSIKFIIEDVDNVHLSSIVDSHLTMNNLNAIVREYICNSNSQLDKETLLEKFFELEKESRSGGV